MGLKSRAVVLKKTYPMCVVYHNGASELAVTLVVFTKSHPHIPRNSLKNLPLSLLGKSALHCNVDHIAPSIDIQFHQPHVSQLVGEFGPKISSLHLASPEPIPFRLLPDSGWTASSWRARVQNRF